MLTRPMKAPTEGVSIEILKAMPYPIACSAKLDGIRGCKTPAGVMSSSLKPLGNLFMQKCLQDPILNGLDGELIVGLPHRDLNDPDDDVFNRTSGAIRRSSGEPDFKFYVFDDFTNPHYSYSDRWINRTYATAPFIKHPYITLLPQKICRSFDEAMAYEEELIAQGYEGMMPRSLTAPYKMGRVTINEGFILKRKPLEQDEAVVVGLFEQQENQNEKVTNELGRSARSSHQENKVGKGTLGGVVLKSPRWKETFNCGTIIGGTDAWRQQIWNNPHLILGQTMTYIYQGYGSIDKPRQPRAKSEFRIKDDMTHY